MLQVEENMMQVFKDTSIAFVAVREFIFTNLLRISQLHVATKQSLRPLKRHYVDIIQKNYLL